MRQSSLMAAIGSLAAATACVAGPVHIAARDGDLARVKGLIGREPELVRATDERRFTPLHWAAAGGHLEMMVFLIDHRADANARNDDGMTPIHLAKDSRKDLLVFLVDHGADPRARSVEGWTALHAAAQAGHKDSVEFLLARGLDVHARCDGPYGTPLTMAAANGRREVAELLLARGADVNERSDDGDCPLHEAASRGQFELVRLLLNRGADVNIQSTSRNTVQARAGNTPLHDAVARGHEEVVGVLLARGADVGARSGRRMTPLHLAVGGGHAGIVRRLLDRGADVASSSDDGLTPLHAIAAGGDVPSAELLLDRGADVNLRSKPSSLIPITAVSPRPNPWGAGGNTPLHLAVLAERSGMVKLLLRRKADADARNDLGRTPFDYARTAEMMNLLRQPARD